MRMAVPFLSRLAVAVAFALLSLAVQAAEKGAFTGGPPTRGKTAALLTALFHHGGPETAREDGATVFPSADPGEVTGFRERAKILEFAKSLIYEGGFFPTEIYQLLGYDNPNTTRIARLTRQLDEASRFRPSPWEVTGRIGRSGLSGSSDHWAMAAGGAGGGLSSPGTLAYLPALAVVYAAYPADGMEAAAQLAILKDDDIRAEAAARAAISLLMRALLGGSPDKDAWIREAAADSGDADTEYDVKSVRIRDWKYLRGEECAMGRLERPLHIWYKNRSYHSAMEEGKRLLRARESAAFLSALAAATYGQDGLPGKMMSEGTADRELLELINDLHDLATSEAVLRVAPQDD